MSSFLLAIFKAVQRFHVDVLLR